MNLSRRQRAAASATYCGEVHTFALSDSQPITDTTVSSVSHCCKHAYTAQHLLLYVPGYIYPELRTHANLMVD